MAGIIMVIKNGKPMITNCKAVGKYLVIDNSTNKTCEVSINLGTKNTKIDKTITPHSTLNVHLYDVLFTMEKEGLLADIEAFGLSEQTKIKVTVTTGDSSFSNELDIDLSW